MGKRFPDDTTVRFNFLAITDAQLALNRGDAANALEALKAAAPYELGDIDPTRLFPVYLRGLACLAAKRGVEAAVEFRKILDHRELMGDSLIAALAHLQIGRADVLQGDTSKARLAYQQFLDLWKNADPDLSILTRARAGEMTEAGIRAIQMVAAQISPGVGKSPAIVKLRVGAGDPHRR